MVKTKKQAVGDLLEYLTLNSRPRKKWRSIVLRTFHFAIGVSTAYAVQVVQPTVVFIYVTIDFLSFI